MMRNNNSSPLLLTPDEASAFDRVSNRLDNAVVDDEDQLSEFPSGVNGLERVLLRYKAFRGRKSSRSGKLVAMTVKTIIKNPSKEQMYLAHVVGWCIEMLEGSCLVAAGKMENLGIGTTTTTTGAKDAFLLEHGMYRILRKYFQTTTKYYNELLELFHDTAFKTAMGQNREKRRYGEGGRGHHAVDDYDMERYKARVKYCFSYYTTYLPIAAGLILTGIRGERLFGSVETVSLLIGEFLQVQEDYGDVFGSQLERTGINKTGENCNKWSWLYATAKKGSCSSSCPPELLLELEKYVDSDDYGEFQEGMRARVKEIYAQIGIPEAYKSYGEAMYGEICEQILEIEADSVKEALWNLVGVMFDEPEVER